MHPFTYIAPRRLEEAVQALTRDDAEVKPLVGGTDLIDQIREGRKSPSVVLDIKRIPEMMRLEYVHNEGIHIGAAVPCTDTAAFPSVQQFYSAIQEACLLIGSVQIQNRASIGGNICNAAPSADTVPGLIVYSAREVVIGPERRREIPLEEFFKGPGQHVMESQEMLLETIVPSPPPNSSAHYLRFIPRNEMDIAIAGAASLLTLEPGTRTCIQARVALAAVAPTPVRATNAEAVLEGQEVTDDLIQQAAERAAETCSPITDVRGTAEYRKELVKVLTRRTLLQCMASLGHNV